MKFRMVKHIDGGNYMVRVQTHTKDEALRLAAKALKAWAKYGEAMRRHGCGEDCSLPATGYTTEYLLSVIASAK